MECLDASDWIAIAALVVSIAAAYFAKSARDAAEKANDINLHSHQKAIYDAFFELKMHMTIKSEFAELQTVSKFYYPALNAKFYFSQEIAGQFKKFFNLCFEVADLARVQRTQTELSEANEKVDCALNIAKQLESKIIEKITLA
jgi:hypothetical protein